MTPNLERRRKVLIASGLVHWSWLDDGQSIHDMPAVESDDGAAIQALIRFCRDPDDVFHITKTKTNKFVVEILPKLSSRKKRLISAEVGDTIADAICKAIEAAKGD